MLEFPARKINFQISYKKSLLRRHPKTGSFSMTPGLLFSLAFSFYFLVFVSEK